MNNQPGRLREDIRAVTADVVGGDAILKAMESIEDDTLTAANWFQAIPSPMPHCVQQLNLDRPMREDTEPGCTPGAVEEPG